MCRRNSRGSYDIHGFREDVRLQEGGQRLQGHQLDAMAKHALEEVAERNEVVVGLLTGDEFHQQVDVGVEARRVGYAATST